MLKLNSGDNTLVVVSDGWIIESDLRGLLPLLTLNQTKGICEGGAAADKVIGKAAAMLIARAGVKEAYGKVVTAAALKLLKDIGIDCSFDIEVKELVNKKTGACPYETAVRGISDLESGYKAAVKVYAENAAQKGSK